VPAKHEPSAGDFATARTALREGLSLREKGDAPQALMRLTSAYDLVPTPVTGFELGKTHMMLGHILQAHELFKKVGRMPTSMEESTRSQAAREEAGRLAKELEPRIPTLRLKVELAPGASAVVRIDDDVIALTGSETVRAVDPGPHDVVAKAGDGPEQKVHVDLSESELKEVSLAPKWVAPKAPPPGETRQIVYVQQTNPLAFIGFGMAAGALVVAGAGYYIAERTRSDEHDQCGNDYCPPSATRLRTLPQNAVADRDFESLNNRYNAAVLVTVVAGLSAAAFIGMGIIGVARPVKEKVTASVRPVVGPGAAGLVGTF
jgi:hypothetical protein